MLALSTMVTRARKGKDSSRKRAQRGDPFRQLSGFVVDGHDDFDVHRSPAWVHVRLERGQGCHAWHGDRPASGPRESRLWLRCESTAAHHRNCSGRRLSGEAVGPAPVSAAAPGALCGRRTVTVSPLPGAEAAKTVPPWAATMAATMERPRPLPPRRAGPGRVDPVEALEDPPGLVGRHAGPSSRTSISAWSPASSTRTVVVVPAGVWARTLASRLSTTWRSRSLSPSPRRVGRPRTARATPGRRRSPCAPPQRPGPPARPAPSPSAPLVEAGQGEEVVDQAVHAGRLGPDARRRPAAGPRAAPPRPRSNSSA